MKAYVPLAFCAAILSGCNTTGGANIVPESRVIDSVVAVSSQPQTRLAEGGGAGVSRAYSKDFRLGSRKIDDYLQRIAKKLLVGFEGNTPKYAISAVFSPYLQAHAAEDNNISFSSQWFVEDHIKSEDQVAAIIAHELAHLILNHVKDYSEREGSVESIRKASGVGTTLIALSGLQAVERGNDYDIKYRNYDETLNNIQNHLIRSGVIAELKQSVIDPMYTRDSEQQADFLAVDLLHKAGYSRFALIDVLKVLKRFRQVAKKETKYLEYVLKKENQQLLSLLKSRAASDDAAQAALTNMLIDKTVSGLQAGLLEWMGGFKMEHMDPDTRIESIKAYVSRHYRKSKRVKYSYKSLSKIKKRSRIASLVEGHQMAKEAEISNNSRRGSDAINGVAGRSAYPWYVMGLLSEGQRSYKKSSWFYNKSIAYGNDNIDAHLGLIRSYINQGDHRRANQKISAAEEIFNDAGPFYEQKLRVAVLRKDREMFDSHMAECIQHPKEEFHRVCEKYKAEVLPDEEPKGLNALMKSLFN